MRDASSRNTISAHDYGIHSYAYIPNHHNYYCQQLCLVVPLTVSFCFQYIHKSDEMNVSYNCYIYIYICTNVRTYVRMRV